MSCRFSTEYIADHDQSIIRLLGACPRLTHLSLTGVQGFLRDEFQQFGREPPDEFTAHQRTVFCVFSGNGVNRLRQYLDEAPEYAALRDVGRNRPAHTALATVPTAGHLASDWIQPNDGEMDEADEEDGFEVLDGSEVVGVAVAPANAGQGGLLAALVPPPPPPIPHLHGATVPVHPGPVVVMGNDSASATPDPEQEDGP